MGDLLFKRFLADRIADLTKAFIGSGVEGILGEFELWLEENGYIAADGNGGYKKWD
jgi:hypothetical protein